MSEERNFIEDVGGYELPEDVPQQVEGESFDYYRHPAGIYLGAAGRLKLKYKDANDKTCGSSDIGARLVPGVLPLWIFEYLGTNTAPQTKMIISKDLVIPPSFTIPEVYYPQMISFDPKDQWKNAKLFGGWKADNLPPIISPKPSKPSIKVTNFQAFPAYYGIQVKWLLVTNDRGSVYVDGGIQLQKLPRVPADKMTLLENMADKRAKEEWEARRQSDTPTQEASETDWDVFGENEKDEKDLPF